MQVRVSKWLKELEKGFYGACESYEKVRRSPTIATIQTKRSSIAYASSKLITSGSFEIFICAQALKGEEVMVEALLRNVYGNDQAQKQNADTLARYVQRYCTRVLASRCTDLYCISLSKLKLSGGGAVQGIGMPQADSGPGCYGRQDQIFKGLDVMHMQQMCVSAPIVFILEKGEAWHA